VLVHFFKAGENINIDVYLGVLKRLLSLGGLWGRLQRKVPLQQDSAPAKKTQEWLQANIPAFWDPQT
ncbi:Hypothetical protein FKW44_018822, partial [Caligus rogercresseyi]